MVCLLCDFKILLTVFNQSYNCQTSHYLGRNQLLKPFVILPSLSVTDSFVTETRARLGDDSVDYKRLVQKNVEFVLNLDS